MMQETEISTRFSGDWTIAGIGERMRSLLDFSSQQTDTVLQGIVVNIDCSGIEKIDVNGLQLLYVWLHCMKMKGFRTRFVNMSTVMREMVGGMEIRSYFEGVHSSPA